MTKGWVDFITSQQEATYYKDIQAQLTARRQQGEQIYPAPDDVLRAFSLSSLSNVKVVILGQDPYHGPDQAHGLAFSVADGVSIPPSLSNIFKELTHNFADYQPPMHGDLSHWAEQGVMLLNTVLTVTAGQANSHSELGWQTFTHAAIAHINSQCEHVVFMLWGAQAQKLATLVDSKKHCILRAPHPSPLSAHRGFFGCKHFALANQWLVQKGREPIKW
jgi:uracil-DNA glycosylase